MTSQKATEFGLSRQSAFGIKSTVPAILLLTDGAGSVEEVQNSEDEKPYGGRIFMGASKLPYHTIAKIPQRVYTENNGLGEHLLGVSNADTKSTPTGATLARRHRFELSTSVVEEFLTIWAKSSQAERSAQDFLLSKLTFNMPKGDLKLVAEYIGTLLAITSTFANTTADYVQPSDSPKKLHSSGVEFFKIGGLTNAVLTRMINGSVDFDNGIDAESGKFAGSEAVHDLEVGDLTVKGSFDFIATTSEVLKFAWEGGEETPVAVTPSHVSNSFELVMGIFGKVIGPANRIEAAEEITKTGTTTMISGGTYTGTEDALYEVEITQGTPDTYKWRKNAGAWSTPANITAGPDAIELGVTVTFSSTTDGLTGDHWHVWALYNHGERIIEAANANPANTGTHVVTTAGTFVGLTDHLYELKISTIGASDKFMWRSREVGGNFSAWSAEVTVTGAAQTLDHGVTVAFALATGGVLGDKWSFVAMEAKHGLIFRFPYCILDPAKMGEQSTRTQVTLPFRVAAPPMQTIGFIDLINEHDTDYDP
jgi:hypothetical protein